MPENIKISVIMPVYKVEQYLPRAVESILNQTFTDYELILVDDGSPDNSGRICDEYAERDARICVIHQKNSGAPGARNAAIDIAQGKYLYFMDSDDWTEPEMLEEMYALAERHRVQLVIAGFYIDTYYSSDKYISQAISEPEAVYHTAQAFRANAYKLMDKNLLYTPWNKLYVSAYIKEQRVLFPQTFWDDFPFNLQVIRDVAHVCVTDRRYYHFLRARADSETARYVPAMYEKREEEHGWLLDLYNYWGINDAASTEFLSRRYIERLIGCIENVTNPNCTLLPKEKKHVIRKMITDPKAQSCARTAVPRSKHMKVMLWPIKVRNVTWTYWQSKLITMVKRRHLKLFATLKARR